MGIKLGQKEAVVSAIREYSRSILTREGIVSVAFIIDRLRYEFHHLEDSKGSQLTLNCGPLEKELIDLMDSISKSMGQKAGLLTSLIEDIGIAIFRYESKRHDITTKFYSVDILPLVQGRSFADDDSTRLTIGVRVHTPSENRLTKDVRALIDGHVNTKLNVPGKTKEYRNYVSEIERELRTNQFIDGGGRPLVKLDLIGSYLRRRLKKEPKKISCKYCGRATFVLRDDQGFCYKPGCRVMATEKKKKRK